MRAETTQNENHIAKTRWHVEMGNNPQQQVAYFTLSATELMQFEKRLSTLDKMYTLWQKNNFLAIKSAVKAQQNEESHHAILNFLKEKSN